MKVVFDKEFFKVYTSDPAAEENRLEPIIEKIKNDPFYEFVQPRSAEDADILRAHTKKHFENIKKNPIIFNISMLAAGGAIRAAVLAIENNPSFGLIRPPGHHASADSCWGFCFFNNMAIALLKLMSEDKINSAFILDFDLHTGDGNINILQKKNGIKILNPSSSSEMNYLKSIKSTIDALENVDIICASAGFDNAVGDWGNTLTTDGYAKIGSILKESSEILCGGRRFAILEGGYNFNLMPTNFNAFCKSFG